VPLAPPMPIRSRPRDPCVLGMWVVSEVSFLWWCFCLREERLLVLVVVVDLVVDFGVVMEGVFFCQGFFLMGVRDAMIW